MKWGTQYGADFVNQLFNGVKTNITGDFQFICLTNEPEGLNPKIENLPLPNIELGSAPIYAGWRKISAFSPQLKEKLEEQSDYILKRMENSYQRLEKVLKAFNRIR